MTNAERRDGTTPTAPPPPPPPPPSAPLPAPAPTTRISPRVAALAVAAVAVLAAAALVAANLAGVFDDDGSLRELEASVGPDAPPGVPAQIIDVPEGDGASAATTPEGPAASAGSPVAVVDAQARSVVVSGTLRSFQRITLRGATLSTSGRVTDASGTDLGEGSVTVAGGDVVAAGGQISLGVTFLRLRPDGSAVIDTGLMPDSSPAAGWSFTDHSGRVTLSGASVTFESSDPETGESTSRTLSGAVTVAGLGGRIQVDYSGDPITWLDPPERFTAAVGWLSWAGGGAIDFQGHRFEHEYLGVRGNGDVELTRAGGAVAISGQLDARQIWTDGHARVKTDARVEVKATPGSVPAGSSGWFTWAPTNDGSYDMAMARITPANDAGRWVELALDPLPKMDGGEQQPRRGGDTTGLRYDDGGFLDAGTQPISSMIRAGSGDERDISVHVPEGTAPGSYTVALLVEGNFDPITVEIPITVM